MLDEPCQNDKKITFTCIKKSTKFCSYGHEAVQDFLADKKHLEGGITQL